MKQGLIWQISYTCNSGSLQLFRSCPASLITFHLAMLSLVSLAASSSSFKADILQFHFYVLLVNFLILYPISDSLVFQDLKNKHFSILKKFSAVTSLTISSSSLILFYDFRALITYFTFFILFIICYIVDDSLLVICTF